MARGTLSPNKALSPEHITSDFGEIKAEQIERHILLVNELLMDDWTQARFMAELPITIDENTAYWPAVHAEVMQRFADAGWKVVAVPLYPHRYEISLPAKESRD